MDEMPRASRTDIEPRRLRSTAVAGGVVQAAGGLALAILASITGSFALEMLRWQVGVGVLLWILGGAHLTLRRRAEEERQDLDRAERLRREQGMQRLFEEEEEGPSVRSLRHMENFVAPAGGMLAAALLFLPGVLALVRAGGGGWSAYVASRAPLTEANLLTGGVGAAVLAFVFLFVGFYAAGLARMAGGSGLRAGAGAMLAGAAWLFLASVALALVSRGWLGLAPDRIVGAGVLLWMTLQAVEMLVNFVLDFYRPRTAGGAARAVYDSRLSGLLAEPQGLFRTFAHTMDYQFGFRISETWFFRFLERAFLPLVLVWAVTLYALGSLVVVRPGEAAVIERWGAPRGMTAVPSDSAGWDAAPRPLGPGLHLKWPWPVETVRLLPRGRTRTVFVGFRVRSGEEADAKARELSRKVVSWDAEHVEDEIKYLMPMPETMEEAPPLAPPGAPEAEAAPPAPVRPAGGAVEEGPRPEGVAGATGRRPALVAAADLPDVLFLSGLFSLEWRVGPAPGDVYRYLYRMRDPEATLRLLFEREVTAYTAGANFWDLLAGEPEHAKERIFRRLREETARLGLGVELVALNIQNVHPPVGEVGKAYQAVLGAREQREALLYGGEVEAIRIEGLVESVFNEKVTEAEAYRHRRVAVSEAEAARFEQQRSADRAAPRVYRHREATAALEAGLAGARKVLVPEGVTVILDDTKILRPTGVEQALVREAAREQAR